MTFPKKVCKFLNWVRRSEGVTRSLCSSRGRISSDKCIFFFLVRFKDGAETSGRVSRVHQINPLGHQSRWKLNIRPRDYGRDVKTDGVTFSNPSSVTLRINLLIENLLAITIALSRSDFIDPALFEEAKGER